MKVVGVIFVILASWGYGSGLIHKLNQHRDQLFSLREMIDMFLGEIQYGKQPLQEACIQIGNRMKAPFDDVLNAIGQRISEKKYESFDSVWQEQFELKEKDFLFTNQEKVVLYDVGKNLGYLDVDTQIRHLQLYKNEVNGLLETLEKTMKEKKKVYRCVSLMVGAMVILLFI